MPRRRFATYTSMLTAAMVAFILGFPFLLVAFARATHCAPDTCGAVGLVFGLYGRMLSVLIYGTAMLTVISARCRRAGLSSWWVVASLFWLLAARDVLMTGLNSWAVGFSLGILSFQWPITLIFFFAFVTFLSLWKGSDENGSEPPRRSWKMAHVSAALSAIIGVVMCIPLFVTLAWIGGLRLISPQSITMFPQHYLYVRIGTHFMTLTTALWLLLLVFAGALRHILVSQRRESLEVPPTRFSRPVS
ncbi:hypothetical protein ASC97_28970 [Rhizobium sp. Root1203]|uniref:hypothetical protein n=1 Tax=Rhizobium sp. Root1203 TaxID=1736427 RepID=UPI00070FD42A|nr:hypothetical protein [Rhizobium sp. Root1203]KQV19704.1 hypothetical protein ASC97_28970 [Rhizobium sp. Root1203]